MLREYIKLIDDKFDLSLYKKNSRLIEVWYSSRLLNAIRRVINPLIIKLKYKLGLKDKKPLKLHLGCGHTHLEGYINIDLRKTRATDLICDITNLPYPENSTEIIENYHAIEHLPRHRLNKALNEWRRILMPGGKLIIECPDFDEIAKKYLAGDEKQLDGIFALQRFEGDYHLFGYNAKRLSRALEESGFKNIEERTPKDYHTNEWPCLRIECAKVIDSDFLDSKAGDDYSLRFTGERVVEKKTPDRIWVDHVARYEFAANYVKGKTVLDIACGTGYGSKILIEKNAEKVFGIDLSKESIEFAAENYTGDGLKFMVGDIYEIDFPDNYFDIIVSFETIEHVNDNQKAFSELSRVLNPEGKLIISSPNRKLTSPGRSINDLPNNAFHEIEYTPKEFALILSKYFYINGLYGQRAIKKIFLIPFVEKILRRYQSRLFSLESGSSAVEKIRSFNEYRYISAICAKPKA